MSLPSINWFKTHKLILVLLLIILFFVINNFPRRYNPVSIPSIEKDSVQSINTAMGAPSAVGTVALPSFSLKQDAGSNTQTSDRIVIKNSNLSLLVKDVRSTGDQLVGYAKKMGGYMVSTAYNRPNESPFATITIRIPSDKFDDALKYFRSLAIKVTSENLVGTDVTEQYTNLDARINTLGNTKGKFEAILEKATTVQEILNVQREIINLQQQIDQLKGQQQALDQDANLSKFTIYLSTDELALPYTPDETFRPNVIFKQAVRSLLGSLRDIGEALIWVGVYSVIWLPALIIIFVIAKWQKKQKLGNNINEPSNKSN